MGIFLHQISDKKYPKLKEVDDVLGGEAAWKNVDATEGKFLCSQVIQVTLGRSLHESLKPINFQSEKVQSESDHAFCMYFLAPKGLRDINCLFGFSQSIEVK